MQYLAIVNRFIEKTCLNSTFTDTIFRKENFSKNVHRRSLFKIRHFVDILTDQNTSMSWRSAL